MGHLTFASCDGSATITITITITILLPAASGRIPGADSTRQ
jgi:hypothetical protein